MADTDAVRLADATPQMLGKIEARRLQQIAQLELVRDCWLAYQRQLEASNG